LPRKLPRVACATILQTSMSRSSRRDQARDMERLDDGSVARCATNKKAAHK
jgi:hypothetical protein